MGEWIHIKRGLFHIDDYYEAVFGGKEIRIDEDVYRHLDKVRSVLEAKIGEGEIIYGVNTGVGALASRILDESDLAEFNLNILRSHSVGFGDYAPPEIARGALLLRVVSISKGLSGVRSGLLKLMETFFNSGAIPIIPMRGSVGASGDLSPLSHLALAIIGDNGGAVEFNGRIFKGSELRHLLLDEIYRDVLDDERVKDLINEDDNGPIVKLSYKEALALNNGTSFTASILLYALHRLEKLIRIADLNAALMLEALSGIKDPFDEVFFNFGDPRYIHPAIETVENVKGLVEGIDGSKLVKGSRDKISLLNLAEVEVEGSLVKLIFKKTSLIQHGLSSRFSGVLNALLKKTKCELVKAIEENYEVHLKCDESKEVEALKGLEFSFKEFGVVQDAYSLRCTPQIHGAARRAIEFARSVILDEINLPNDNPLIVYSEEEGLRILSGGNFHGQSLALAAENLALAISYIANISERRLFRLLDPSLNNGLPPFLAMKPGLESGLMLVQYLVADLLSEIRQLATPVSVHTIPTSANQEDVVSMSATASIRLLKMIDSLEAVLASEQIVALQGIAYRTGWPMEKGFEGASRTARQLIEFYKEKFRGLGPYPIEGDVVLSDYIRVARESIYEVYERFL